MARHLMAPSNPAVFGVQSLRNTFQAVLASFDSSSYAIFLYPEDGLQFYTTFSKTARKQVPAKVAFSQGLVGRLWSSNGTVNVFAEDAESLRNLARSSNCGQPGVWLFEIGSPAAHGVLAPSPVAPGLDYRYEYDDEDYDTATQLGLEMEAATLSPVEARQRGDMDTHKVPSVLAPRRLGTEGPAGRPTERARSFQLPAERFPQQHPQVIDVDEVEETGVVFSYNTDSRQTCANSRHQCSVHAECKDFASGFCCRCAAGYTGNGRQCVAEGTPQRVNGKVKGRIFVGSSQVPVSFEHTDLHSYVVTNHGRSYTAISTIPETVGYSLLPLAPIGGIIGWMFAVEQDGFKNGFSITDSSPRNKKSNNSSVSKTLMKSPLGKLVPGAQALWPTGLSWGAESGYRGRPQSFCGPGPDALSRLAVVTSSSTRQYSVTEPEASDATVHTYQWRQTISFQECAHDPARPAPPRTQQLSVDSVFVLYNREERILRYALSNAVGPVRDGSPDALQNPCYIGTHGCDTSAACRPGSGTQFTCECAIGFRGDGRTCYDVDECAEQPSVCGSHAVCNNHPGTFRCECVEGYQFSEDGACVAAAIQRPVDYCSSGLHDCDIPQRARCVYTGGSTYTCSCLPGFSGDGRACHGAWQRPVLSAAPHLQDKVIIGLAFDCVDGMVYWTDISEPSIGRASLQGGEPAAIVRQDLGSPEGIALDHLGRNIFWTDSRLDRIEVAKLDGTQRRVLFDTDLVNPRGIVTDAISGNLYWTDWNRERPKIETAYMDGTHRRVLVQDDLGLPNGLTFDAYLSQLCWVDAGTGRAECLKPGQAGRRRVLEGLQYPFAVTSHGKNLYYTDWKTNSVVAVDLAISKETDAFHPHKQTRLYGVTTAPSQCPQGHNYCSVNNGGCTHLCLATPGSRTCRCPDNTVGVDCVERK
ncbi:PREDICTED: nidogen-1 [Condylura cristata]|uniref:nidogen-1 n=1 Tax=Condylura cristata TaxID=143302 RepID=UPI000643806A|nr:PREDICTED: nidogen-1 [Condylura cristata]